MGQDMQVARIGESATVLEDGRVLVAGGIGPDLKDLSSAEMFQPNTGTWTTVAPLPQTRFSHSATLLSDGRVLVVDGIVNGSISRSTVIYDPRFAAWTPGSSTGFGHAQQSSATLRDGRILVAGGYGLASELYDPRSNTWSTVGTIPFRAQPVMGILADGKVLLAAGIDRRAKELRTTEIYEPLLGRWHQTGELHTGRDAATGTVLGDGEVLLAGGRAFTFKTLKTAELYDPNTGRWTAAASMHAARVAASAVLLHDGSVLTCGGTDFADGIRSCELYHS
jgi:N-acetylneuraminic acid mutarotase